MSYQVEEQDWDTAACLVVDALCLVFGELDTELPWENCAPVMSCAERGHFL